MENKPLNKNWKKKVVLSGIRPTGSLHLNQFVILKEVYY